MSTLYLRINIPLITITFRTSRPGSDCNILDWQRESILNFGEMNNQKPSQSVVLKLLCRHFISLPSTKAQIFYINADTLQENLDYPHLANIIYRTLKNCFFPDEKNLLCWNKWGVNYVWLHNLTKNQYAPSTAISFQTMREYSWSYPLWGELGDDRHFLLPKPKYSINCSIRLCQVPTLLVATTVPFTNQHFPRLNQLTQKRRNSVKISD